MSDLPPRCKGMFGRRLCKWEGRYDYKPPDAQAAISYDFWAPLTGPNSRDVLGTQTYVRDVCVNCGQTKERAI